MGQAAALTDTYPGTMNVDKGLLAEAIESCLDCFQVCTACADACLAEEDVKPLAKCKCIRNDLDCASICAATVEVLSRHTDYDANITRAQLQACLAATKACADSCAEHAGHHEHCRLCEQACRRCVIACEQLLAAIG